MNRDWQFMMLFLIAHILCSCTTIHPWQRGILQKRCMGTGIAAQQVAFDAHVIDTREAMMGAAGGEGVPCGCN